MKNEYRIIGDEVVIYLKCKGIKLETIINLADLEKADSFDGTWHAQFDPDINNYYVAGNAKKDGRYFKVLLHRMLCDAPKGMVVDHINRNSMDNRRSNNLRVITDAQNKQNTQRRRNSCSQYRGVTKQSGKWIARIKVNGKRMYLGSFHCELQAAKAAKDARLKYFPYTVEEELIV